jgi:cyanophycinase-like exopeptidase
MSFVSTVVAVAADVGVPPVDDEGGLAVESVVGTVAAVSGVDAGAVVTADRVVVAGECPASLRPQAASPATATTAIAAAASLVAMSSSGSFPPVTFTDDSNDDRQL